MTNKPSEKKCKCGGDLRQYSNDGDNPMTYFCDECDAFVEEPMTNKPSEIEEISDRIERIRRRYDQAKLDGMDELGPRYAELWFYGELRDFISDLLAKQKAELIEEAKEFEQSLNQFDISSDAIDDDNRMLKQLIINCRNFLSLIKEEKEEEK